jgi:hypothetical protein
MRTLRRGKPAARTQRSLQRSGASGGAERRHRGSNPDATRGTSASSWRSAAGALHLRETQRHDAALATRAAGVEFGKQKSFFSRYNVVRHSRRHTPSAACADMGSASASSLARGWGVGARARVQQRGGQ